MENNNDGINDVKKTEEVELTNSTESQVAENKNLPDAIIEQKSFIKLCIYNTVWFCLFTLLSSLLITMIPFSLLESFSVLIGVAHLLVLGVSTKFVYDGIKTDQGYKDVTYVKLFFGTILVSGGIALLACGILLLIALMICGIIK